MHHVCAIFKTHCTRIGDLLVRRRRKQKRRSIKISAPFDFKHETTATLPGISNHEICFLREKAIAGRMSIAKEPEVHARRAPPRPDRSSEALASYASHLSMSSSATSAGAKETMNVI